MYLNGKKSKLVSMRCVGGGLCKLQTKLMKGKLSSFIFLNFILNFSELFELETIEVDNLFVIL